MEARAVAARIRAIHDRIEVATDFTEAEAALAELIALAEELEREDAACQS